MYTGFFLFCPWQYRLWLFFSLMEMSSVVEPEPPFLAGAVKKGVAPALQLNLHLWPYV